MAVELTTILVEPRSTLTMTSGIADRDADDGPTSRTGSACAGPRSSTRSRSRCTVARAHQTGGGGERAADGRPSMGAAKSPGNRRPSHTSPARQHRGGVSRARQTTLTKTLRSLRLRGQAPRAQAAPGALRPVPCAGPRRIHGPLAQVQALSSPSRRRRPAPPLASITSPSCP